MPGFRVTYGQSKERVIEPLRFLGYEYHVHMNKKHRYSTYIYIYIPKASFVTLILVTRYLGITFPIYARRGEKCSMFVESNYTQLSPSHHTPSPARVGPITFGAGGELCTPLVRALNWAGAGSWESCLLYFMSNLTKDRAAICNG